MADDTLMPVPDVVPARMVNEFAYCPRLAYLEWVQGEFVDNADTAEGRYRHRVVDRPGGALPPAEDQPVDSRIHARSVWLTSEEEGITAKADLIEGSGDAVTPVDYKRGAAPDNPEQAWETDRVQLCAQGLVLRANGYTCREGVLYYIESKTRVLVVFDDALVARTRQLVRDLREMAARGVIPRPLAESPKCVRCSLSPICLPDETNALSATANPKPAVAETPRRLMPARDDAAPLYVQEHGARVSKSGEVFEVWLKDSKLAEARIFETSHIALFGSAQITTPALSEAFDRGISVTFFSTGGWFKGMAHGPAHKNVSLRMAQYRAAFDAGRCLVLARAFVAAKIRNCRTLLMRNHHDPPRRLIDDLLVSGKDAQSVATMAGLLGVEGNAARLYFGAFEGMLKPKVGVGESWSFDFEGRNRRPPRDAVNAMLSFAYALLARELTVIAQAVGFDPYLGFYHQPRYGRPSLGLDVMEEFRPLIADSVVLSAVNNGVVAPQDFLRAGPAVALSPVGRRKFLQAYESRLETQITHPLFGYKISYRRVLEVQLRLLSRWLLGEVDEYPAFTTR
ncbi:MAG: CRISPR-associated endonuclease Cas1 [Thermoflexales bacterium]|nr:CRISPR-associated endonuclease Cas1 [Thermoflexales bacterium]